MPDVAVEVEVDGDGDEILCAKISTGVCEVNVRADRAAFLKLTDITEADWLSGRSLAVGTSAGSPVFWTCEGATVDLLIGVDDETWDIAVRVPLDLVEELVDQVAKA